ncbi:MAG: hemB [Gammaproteobacteria bacterium]|jgi:porphobilinogen synthase|nr:hemB [Gammaproteobacteria bacterium]
MQFPVTRLRRLRGNPVIRDLVQETHLRLDDCVLPLFIRHGEKSFDIGSMPGHRQLCLKDLSQEISTLTQLGIRAVILFGIPENKDAIGSDSYLDDGIIQQAIKVIKTQNPAMYVITDVCFCEYTDHGHCGFICENHPTQDVDNDKTLELIAKQALSHAKAGADMVAPSGNMDGMVGAIRTYLDQHGFSHTPILSYAVKYASSFYGPFREAAEGAPQFGDRKTYQMNPANSNEALREAALDVEEGADILMVKPGGPYLDIIYRIKQAFPQVPLCAYQVSGEFSMIKAAAEKGWIDEKKVALESLISIKRAGADFIITYFAREIAKWLND